MIIIKNEIIITLYFIAQLLEFPMSTFYFDCALSNISRYFYSSNNLLISFATYNLMVVEPDSHIEVLQNLHRVCQLLLHYRHLSVI